MHRLMAAFVLTATLALVNHSAQAQQQFDGRWSIEAVPAKGACRRTHYYKVVIENGVPRNAVSRRTKDRVTGGLEPDGRVQASVQRNKAKIDITGKLTGRSGSGAWTMAGSIACSGLWTASK